MVAGLHRRFRRDELRAHRRGVFDREGREASVRRIEVRVFEPAVANRIAIRVTRTRCVESELLTSRNGQAEGRKTCTTVDDQLRWMIRVMPR